MERVSEATESGLQSRNIPTKPLLFNLIGPVVSLITRAFLTQRLLKGSVHPG